ncbi:hypothetical protein L596_019031 [Steinernema carpocapsae]|uniref:Uncharacterized protein n=2 Tax=Steinernema carpocapsae TaxID=34508 RepID=A0A4U5N6G2_STECR|nr:hypothetical protein L596_019031 [Steinernema carpocapsae]
MDGESSAPSGGGHSAQLKMAERVEIVLRRLEDDLRVACNPVDEEKQLQVFEVMYNLLGPVVISAVGLVDSNCVKRVSSEDERQTLIEVLPSGSGCSIHLYPNVNYCICSSFQEKVVRDKSAYTYWVSV